MMRQDWIEIELGKIAKIFNGNSINARLKEEKYKVCKTGLNYIGTKDVAFDGNIEYENGVRIPFDEPKFKIAPKGCVLVCSEGGSAGRKTGYIEENVCFGNKLFAITNEYSVFEGKYVYYYTRYRKFFQEFKNQLNGIIGGVNAKKFSNIKIDLSPLPEQRAIVSKIEELFSDLDKGVADLKKAQDQLKVYRQAVLKKAFDGELTNTQMIPRTMDSLTSIITKGASPKWQGFNYTTDSNQLLFITSENVREGYISLEKEKYLPVGFNEVQKRSVLQKGDVLFNIVGASIGRSAIFELDKLSNINQAVALIRLDAGVLNQYVNYFLNSEGAKQEYLKKQVDVARANLSLQNVKDIEIPFCNVDEQRIVIQEIESRLSVCDKVEESINESLEKAKALRQSILKKAFEGRLLSNEEIEKCKAEPDYEPAAVLLEKIKMKQ